MSDPVVVKVLEEFQRFRNEKGFVEVVLRDSKKRIKAIQKVMIDNLQQSEQQELAQKVIHALNENTKMNERNLKLLANVAKVQKFGLLLNGLNLAATCVGFAVMYAKLDGMKAELSQKLDQIHKTVKDTHSTWTEYEFEKVLSLHSDMLDCRRKNRPYSEEQLRALVDREYNVLMLLVSSFLKNISGDNDSLIVSIFSVLAMMTASVCNLDEVYYLNNHKVLGDQNPWHQSHDKWMAAYDKLQSKEFVEKLQDYGTFETRLNTTGVDVYYISLMDQVSDLREAVKDNQILIVTLGDAELLRQYRELSEQDIAASVEAAFREAGSGLDEEVVMQAYQAAMQQAAVA